MSKLTFRIPLLARQHSTSTHYFPKQYVVATSHPYLEGLAFYLISILFQSERIYLWTTLAPTQFPSHEIFKHENTGIGSSTFTRPGHVSPLVVSHVISLKVVLVCLGCNALELSHIGVDKTRQLVAAWGGGIGEGSRRRLRTPHQPSVHPTVRATTSGALRSESQLLVLLRQNQHRWSVLLAEHILKINKSSTDQCTRMQRLNVDLNASSSSVDIDAVNASSDVVIAVTTTSADTNANGSGSCSRRVLKIGVSTARTKAMSQNL
ncbi:hypothetical protein CVT26_000489 [Gymnopilus dilepis]|uniref:Uncharacterized protein n=1 Tax=Gymnopilus dilepis TaxID=231916 RepID=A0A409VGY7_9AGAR|nr:hypothetical protein CVT26_000489 [Gymnopilus dilepis]